MCYIIYIAGTSHAKMQWKSGKTYSSRSSAHRRAKQIRAAHDVGVEGVVLIPVSLLR